MNIEEIDTYPKFNLRGSIGPSVSDGILEMFGGPESVSPSDLRDFLDENKEASTIVVEISSPGGYINEAVEMFDMLRASGKEVVTIGYRVNSAASVVMLAGDEGKRFAAENAECVIHKAAVPAEALMGGPRLTDDELGKLATEGKKENKRILDLYVKVLGRDKEQPLLALMAAETNLGAKGMLKYGFANKIYKPKKKVALDNLKLRAFTVTPAFVNLIENKITTDMSKDTVTKKDFEQFENSFMAKIKNLFKGSKAFKADVSLQTNDGKTINVVTEDEEIDGKPAQIDGAPAAAGDYTLDDGRVVTVDDAGNISGVKNVDGPDSDALKTENTALKDEVKTLKTELSTVKTDLSTAMEANKIAVKNVNELKTEFANFKKTVTGDDGGKEPKQIDAKEWANMSISQRILESRKRERAAAKQ